MTERYRHQEELFQIGLTPEEVEKRGIAAVGHGVNELFPPYNNILHYARAQKILKRMGKSAEVVTFKDPHAILKHDWKTSFPNTKVIEVVGGLTSWCVIDAVKQISNAGLYALVDSGLTFEDRSYYPNFVLSRHLKQGVSSEIKHLKLGRGKYIFYKPTTRTN